MAGPFLRARLPSPGGQALGSPILVQLRLRPVSLGESCRPARGVQSEEALLRFLSCTWECGWGKFLELLLLRIIGRTVSALRASVCFAASVLSQQ